MWLKLVGSSLNINYRPGESIPLESYINTDHIARIEFFNEGPKFKAVVTTIKATGADKTNYEGDDAKILLEFVKKDQPKKTRK